MVIEPPGLDVVVELELVGVRAQADGVDLIGSLVLDPGLDEVGWEDSSGLQVFVIGLKGRKGLG